MQAKMKNEFMDEKTFERNTKTDSFFQNYKRMKHMKTATEFPDP